VSKNFVLNSQPDLRFHHTIYYVEVKRVSTGSSLLDDLLNGGIERGIITNIYGESGTGKTNFCVQVAAAVAEKGDKVAYIDTEGGFSPERIAQISSEKALENILVKNPLEFTQQKEVIKELEKMVERNDVQLVIVDSAVSLYRLKVNGDNASKINQELSKQLSELSKTARKHNIPVIITNQVYTSFDEEELELVGRDVPKYWSKCLLKLSDGKSREIEVSKHRSLPRGLSKEFSITDEGIVKSKKTSNIL